MAKSKQNGPRFTFRARLGYSLGGLLAIIGVLLGQPSLVQLLGERPAGIVETVLLIGLIGLTIWVGRAF